jgi:phospholipid/cholesterol/gamma-HCH transport system substrate-binding protein
MRRRLVLIGGGLALIGLLAAGLYFGVKAAYGAFRGYYYVTADFERAGQQVQIGSDVRVRGVIVGKVSSIELVDRHARLTLQIEDEYEVPRTAEAVVTLKTLLGSKFVDLRFDPDDKAPLLADGDEISETQIGPELEDALEDGTEVLAALKPEDAATLVHELATASRDHGDDVARGLDANADLSTTFAQTTKPQLESLRDFRILFGELEDKGDDMNRLAFAMNEGVPVYASSQAQRDFAAALDGLASFSNDFADLLIFQRNDWDRMMNAGDVVLGTIAARPGGLADMVHGLYRYVFKLGKPIGPNLLPDGSAAAGFVNFIGGNDQDEEQNQICDALSPEERELVPMCKRRGQ